MKVTAVIIFATLTATCAHARRPARRADDATVGPFGLEIVPHDPKVKITAKTLIVVENNPASGTFQVFAQDVGNAAYPRFTLNTKTHVLTAETIAQRHAAFPLIPIPSKTIQNPKFPGDLNKGKHFPTWDLWFSHGPVRGAHDLDPAPNFSIKQVGGEQHLMFNGTADSWVACEEHINDPHLATLSGIIHHKPVYSIRYVSRSTTSPFQSLDEEVLHLGDRPCHRASLRTVMAMNKY